MRRCARLKIFRPNDLALTVRVISRRGAERIVRRAFEYAQKHNYPTVTLVEKPNVLRETSGLMTRVARTSPRIIQRSSCGKRTSTRWRCGLSKIHSSTGVLVTSNLFGDVISDLCAQLVGGLGFAASGNIGDKFAVFEPTHGSAPKYAGQYKVNPIATFLAAKLMLDWLGETEKAKRLEKAIAGRHRRRQGAHVRYGRKNHDAGDGGSGITKSSDG